VPDHQALWAAIGRLCATPERLNVVDVADAANLALADVASMARDAYSTDAEVVGNWRDVILRKAKLRRLSGQFRNLAGAAEAPGADLEAIQREAAASVLALEQEGEGPKRRSRRE
ncbi:hypothetical protein, partial [Staphylococcus aureus]|uniref:hypothetical protein n=1 Tax=Staphylococcus aureus TaxID=1280 RepID=UPI00301BAF8A